MRSIWQNGTEEFFASSQYAATFLSKIFFNDKLNWNNNHDEFLSLAIHEIGHVIGLGHSDDPTSVMYPHVSSVTQLGWDEVECIQVCSLHFVDVSWYGIV